MNAELETIRKIHVEMATSPVAGGAPILRLDHSDFGVFDLQKILSFGEDLGHALDTHAPTMSWWIAMAAEEKQRLVLFREGFATRYMAHARFYAKLALKGLGDKETLEAVKDHVSVLFSRKKSVLTPTFTRAAFQGFMQTTHGTATAATKFLNSKTLEELDQLKDSFETDMYFWEREMDVTYDDVVEIEADIERSSSVLSRIIDVMEQRGVLLSSSSANQRADKNALGVQAMNKATASLSGSR